MKIKPLRWRKPQDTGSDFGHDNAICVADGIGGKYSLSKSGDGFLLWWPYDEFTFVECKTLADAKGIAENHWQDAVSRVLLCETV